MTPRMSNELKTGKIASWYNQKVIATLREEHVPATLKPDVMVINVCYGSKADVTLEEPTYGLF
jgi:hypothetical protein